ncbi:MAG: hypothetical protein HY908_25625 [Myxococcales bacterium]|nr:hypothetical protein [Myxococcales bacterium]
MSARRGRWTRARLALLLAVLALVVASAAACGGARVEPSGQARGWLGASFKARAGDDPAWSDADLDDGDWAEVDSALRPGTSIPGWAGIGWFRGWIDVPRDAAGRSWPIYGRFVGAAEVFIDGQRQLAAGDPDAVVAGGPTPIDFDTQTPRWVTFSRPGRQLIAVRFASDDVGALHRVGFPASATNEGMEFDKQSVLGQLRVVGGYRVTEGIALYAGPVLVSYRSASGKRLSDISYVPTLATSQRGGTTQDLGLGYVVGVELL